MDFRDDIARVIKTANSVLRRRARLAQSYMRLFEDPDGKVVLNDIFSTCGILKDITPPATDDERSYAAGQRSIAIHIIERMRWSEGELVRLAQQQAQDEYEAAEEARA